MNNDKCSRSRENVEELRTYQPFLVSLKTFWFKLLHSNYHTTPWSWRSKRVFINPTFVDMPKPSFPKKTVRSEVLGCIFQIIERECLQIRRWQDFTFCPRSRKLTSISHWWKSQSWTSWVALNCGRDWWQTCLAGHFWWVWSLNKKQRKNTNEKNLISIMKVSYSWILVPKYWQLSKLSGIVNSLGYQFESKRVPGWWQVEVLPYLVLYQICEPTAIQRSKNMSQNSYWIHNNLSSVC